MAYSVQNLFFESTLDIMKWGNRKSSQDAVTGSFDFYTGNGYTYVKDTTHFSIESPLRTNGIYINSGVKYVKVVGIDVRHAVEGGIEGKNVWYSTIQNCYSWYNGTDYDVDGEGIYWIAGKYDTLRSNIIKDVGFHGIYCSVYNESVIDSSVGNVIEHNIIGNCYHTEIDLMNTGGGDNNIHHFHKNHIVRFNLIYNDSDFNSLYSVHGIQVQGNVLPGAAQADIVDNVQIYYNLIYNLKGIGIYSNYFSDHLFIYNNTIANGEAGIAIVGSGGINSVIKNNIVHIIGSDYNIALSNISTKIVDYNLYYHSFYTMLVFINSNGYSGINAFNIYRNITGFDQHGFNTNPLFKNLALSDFSLNSNSPAIDAGNNVGLSIDILGNHIVGNPDLGSYEFQTADISPPELLHADLINHYKLLLTFSEKLLASSTTNISNYNINNNIIVQNSELISDGSQIILTTSYHDSLLNYLITVSNVKDLAGNLISSQSNSATYHYFSPGFAGFQKLPVISAYSSSWYQNYSPDKSIDGLGYQIPDSRWAGSIPMPDTISYDFGSTYLVSKIRCSFYRWEYGRLYHFNVFTSQDNFNWTNVLYNVLSGMNEWSEFEFPQVLARYVKVISL